MAHPSGDPLLLVYLDAYHLGDPLFLQRFAPIVKAHEGPLALIHGSGEAAERALEAEGLIVPREGGRLKAEGGRQLQIVERATRDLNRQIVEALNEVGVAALRLNAYDRGLVRHAPDDRIVTGKVDWLETLLAQGVVPVVAALLEQEAAAEEVDASTLLFALAKGLEPRTRAVRVVAFVIQPLRLRIPHQTHLPPRAVRHSVAPEAARDAP